MKITGKGGKQRHCPLWPTTIKELIRLIGQRAPTEHVFLNRCGAAVTRFGIHTGWNVMRSGQKFEYRRSLRNE